LCLEHGWTVSLYVSQQKSELLDSLETQVRFSQLVAVLVGARGLGKSFLLEQLHHRLKDEVAIASVDASMAMSDDQLDKTISLQLGLSWQESNSDLATRISNTHSEKVLITIDNAHLLSASCLEFVLKLNQSQLSEKQSSLFILLAGESSLPVSINKTPTFTLHPEMCVVFEVEPIQQSETRAIIDTFSHPNSEVLKELKNGSKLDYFWQLAKGNPAELNYHMSRWLDEHSPTQVVEVDTKTNPNAVLKAVVYSLLAIVLSAMLVYQDEINQWISPPSESNKENSDQTLANDTPPKLETDEKEQLTKQQVVGDSNELADSLTSEAQKKTKQAFDRELEKTEKAMDSAAESQLSTEKVKENQSEVDQATVLESSRKTKKTNNQNKALSESQTQLPVETQTTTSEIERSQSLTTEEQGLLAADSGLYLLQWAGVSSREAAEKYRDNHIAKEQMSIYRRANSGKTLFIVVSDSFSNRALAEFALNDYLQQGIKEKPWIKSYELVHKEIQQFEQSKP
jgi:type II secretory pathway predicted ATPase ExeA/septal ring-binding cell division protein DamX